MFDPLYFEEKKKKKKNSLFLPISWERFFFSYGFIQIKSKSEGYVARLDVIVNFAL